MSHTGTACLATGQAESKLHPSCESAVKRFTDIAVAIIAILLLLPLLCIIALAIRIDSPGPALFRQSRGGLNGRPFTILKFRTMKVQEDGHEVRQAQRNDARITTLGAILRKTSLDELPQLLNVLEGNMSLVGPRPHALSHDAYYGALLPTYKQRAQVKPGLTGSAQISGYRGETSDDGAMMRRVECDLEYVAAWTSVLDAKIILLTIIKVPFDKRAY